MVSHQPAPPHCPWPMPRLRGRPWWNCLLALALVQCGTEAGNPKKPGGGTTPPSTSAYAGDSDAATALISTQVDETTDAMADESDSASGAALTLTGLAGNGTEFTRTCVDGTDGSATVTRQANGDFENVRRRGLIRLHVTRQGKDQATLVWKKTGKDVRCNNAHTAAKIAWGDGDEVSMNATIDRSRTTTLARVADGKVLSQRKITATGQRSVQWKTAASQTSGDVTREKTLQNDMQLSFDLTGRDGATHTVTTHSTIAQDTPVVVSTTYDAGSNGWTRQVIQSGKISMDLKDDARVEMIYDQVTYTADGGCRPVSGTLTGATFAVGVADPILTFTIDFAQGLNEADGPVSIIYNNGDKKTYYPESCLLDRDGG